MEFMAELQLKILDSNGAPQENLTISPRALTIAPQALTIAPQILTIAPQILTIAPQALTIAPRALTIAPRYCQLRLYLYSFHSEVDISPLALLI